MACVDDPLTVVATDGGEPSEVVSPPKDSGVIPDPGDAGAGVTRPDTRPASPEDNCIYDLAPRAHIVDRGDDDQLTVYTASISVDAELVSRLDLRVGDVVVGSSPEQPFLRRLTSTTSIGGRARFETESATLRDAFTRLRVDVTCPSNGGSIRGNRFLTLSHTVRLTSTIAGRFETEGELSLELTGRLWGLIEFGFGGVDRFETTFELTLEGAAQLETAAHVSLDLQRRLATIPRVRVGPPIVMGPVVLTPGLRAALDIELEVVGGLRLVWNQPLFRLSGELGVRYDGNWQPVSQASADLLPNFGSPSAFTLEPYGELRARLSMPIALDVRIYDVAGPGLTLAPYGERAAEVALPVNPPPACFDITVGSRAGIAVRAEASEAFLGSNARVEFDLYDRYREVGRQIFPYAGPCCGDGMCSSANRETCTSCRDDCGACRPQCVGHPDCAANQFCRAGACVPDTCAQGQSFCAGLERRECSAHGDSSILRDACRYGCTPSGCAAQCGDDGDCAAGDFCSGGACLPDLCPAGQLYCSGGQRRRCSVNGASFTVLENCPFACAPAACSAQCVNDMSCSSTQHCAAGTCVADACAQGQTYCDGDEVRTCDARGVASTLVATCPFGCVGAACANQCVRDTDCSADRYCSGGTCLSDACPQGQAYCAGNERRSCSANGASSMAIGPCAFGCRNGACAAQCSADTDCLANQFCSGGTCVVDTCAENQVYCSGNERRRCSVNGSSSTLLQTCPFACSSGSCTAQCTSDMGCATDQFCSGGSCVADSCPEGQTYCAGNERRSCAANGAFYSSLGACPFACSAGACVAQCSGDGDCSAPQYCAAGSCAPDACVQGTTYCAGNERRQCQANGSAYTRLGSCPGSCSNGMCVGQCAGNGGCAPQEYCSGGACQPDQCVQGQLFCDGNERRQCAADGSTSNLVGSCPFGCSNGACTAQCNGNGDCAADRYCQAGACQPDPCVQGQPFCAGNERRQCSADGSTSTSIEVCSNGCSPSGCTASCGDGVCSALEDPASCIQDCRAWITNPNIPYFQSQAVSAVNQCTTDVGWHHGTNNPPMPHWTWASSCTIPPTSNLLTYDGFSVRWPVEVRRSGRYRITVWYPCVDEVCSINGVPPANRYAGGLYFGLTRGASGGLLLGPLNLTPCGSNELFADVFLPVGNHQLILYDRGQSGNICNVGTSAANRWVFADNAGISWVGP
jgi:hypothetical protein